MLHKQGDCAGWRHGPYDLSQCKMCHVRQNPATVRGGAIPLATQLRYASSISRIPLPVTLVQTSPCCYLGEAQPAQSCGCREKLRACDIHGLCTTGSPRAPHHCCESCSDYRSLDTPDLDRRHLLCYIYPVTDNGIWEKWVDKLRAALPLFNGRRVVAIATNSLRNRLDDPDTVRKRLGPEFDVLLVPHVKKLGEVTAFLDLWSRLQQFTSPNDFTFYCHSKGATKPVNSGISVHRWGDLMWTANVDHWDEVRESLRHHPVTGAFKKSGLCFGGRGTWHYTGTFYWCRNADVFAGNWRNLWQHYGGTELWPAQMWDDASSGCHFYGGTGFNMYSVEEVARAERCIDIPNWVSRDMGDPEMLRKLRETVATLPEPPTNLSGRAVMTFTSKMFNPGTYVLIKMLRHFGYAGEVQVWARPTDPCPPVIARLPGVKYRIIEDADTNYRYYQRTWAMLDSGLEDILWIGSDAYPICDVTPWFDYLSICGNVLWEDSRYGDMFEPGILGLPDSSRASMYTPQGDLMLFNMKKMWKTTMLWHWLNVHEHYYHPGTSLDQAMLRGAMLLTDMPNARFSPDRVVIDPFIQDARTAEMPFGMVLVYQHQGPDNKPAVIHRTRAKMTEEHPEIHMESLPHEELAWSFFDEYRALCKI